MATGGGAITAAPGSKVGRSAVVVTGGGAITAAQGNKAVNGAPVVLTSGGYPAAVGEKGPVRVPPRPVPPTAAPALPDPTSPPVLTPVADGTLTPGLYRYAYAGWRLSTTLCTAPSPVAELELPAGQGGIEVSYDDVPGADGHLLYRQMPGEDQLSIVGV